MCPLTIPPNNLLTPRADGGIVGPMSSTAPATTLVSDRTALSNLVDSHNGWVDTPDARAKIKSLFGRINDATLVNVMNRTVEQIEAGRVTKLAVVKLEFGIAEMESRIR